ncbi:DNA-packaging protein FI [Escherichia fergusonii]|uniref:DNA-packaging protein FI n=1 Tax=Escherichia TaxID=561 RepID=UPI001E5239D2|nr:DNA-packaging protein FI [Escherichia fergusonii]UEX73021.1 DNA-packaging protein FI [Escherichia fergusonii]
MTKDELIARLQVLGEQLNRDVSLTGTKEELALRVAELEEELDDTAGQDTSVNPENALTGHENEVVSAQPDTVIQDKAELVTVVALVTLHTDALHATRDEPVAFVLPGTAFRVSAGVAAEMTERGLARMQ